MALGHFKHGEHSDTARCFGFPPAGKLQYPPLCEGLHRGEAPPKIRLLCAGKVTRASHASVASLLMFWLAHELLSLCQEWTCCTCLLFIPVVINFLSCPPLQQSHSLVNGKNQ